MNWTVIEIGTSHHLPCHHEFKFKFKFNVFKFKLTQIQIYFFIKHSNSNLNHHIQIITNGYWNSRQVITNTAQDTYK